MSICRTVQACVTRKLKPTLDESDLEEPNRNSQVETVEKPTSQGSTPPEQIRLFLQNTYRKRNINLTEYFPDLPSFSWVCSGYRTYSLVARWPSHAPLEYWMPPIFLNAQRCQKQNLRCSHFEILSHGVFMVAILDLVPHRWQIHNFWTIHHKNVCDPTFLCSFHMIKRFGASFLGLNNLLTT